MALQKCNLKIMQRTVNNYKHSVTKIKNDFIIVLDKTIMCITITMITYQID